MRVLLSLLTILVARVSSIPDYNMIRDKYQKYVIVPYYIPYPPIDILTSIFGEYRANFGNIIPLCGTLQEPLTSWPNPDSNALYTLVATVLPSVEVPNPNRTSELFELVFNIPGANVQDGDKVVPYLPPNPPLGGGFRRGVCLIYRQPKRIEVTSDVLLRYVDYEFRNFSINQFVAFYELGNPIAGNFFRVQQSPCENQCATSGCCNNGCSNGCSNGYKNGYNNGYNNGCNNGCSNGCNNGYNNGYNNDCNDGYSNDYNNGCNNNCAP